MRSEVKNKKKTTTTTTRSAREYGHNGFQDIAAQRTSYKLNAIATELAEFVCDGVVASLSALILNMIIVVVVAGAICIFTHIY